MVSSETNRELSEGEELGARVVGVVGDFDGALDGCGVLLLVGPLLGKKVGDRVGEREGFVLNGAKLGVALGFALDGDRVGEREGTA